MKLDELEAKIKDELQENISGNFVFQCKKKNGENVILGNFSDAAALTFMKHLAIERPKAWKEIKKWKPK